MKVVKRLCGTNAKSGRSQPSHVAADADLSAPSFTAFDRIGSSLRHCYSALHNNEDSDQGYNGEWDDLLKKLG